MIKTGSAALAICIGAWCSAAQANTTPAVLASAANQPYACATPGRLMAFAKRRNPALRKHFDKVAVDYMRHGIALNIRWDYAFFQMLLETASLKFTGDVNWGQNNFAGLGATGGGVRGERFASVSDGVRAHLEHLLIYAGVKVDAPVAERTRKVQAWKILVPWQRSIRGPITFAHIGQKWAPGDRSYARDIRAIANDFLRSHCRQRDPRPDLVAAARATQHQRAPAHATTSRSAAATSPRSSLGRRASLGARTVYRNGEVATSTTGVPAGATKSANAPATTKPFGANVNVLNRATKSPASAQRVPNGSEPRAQGKPAKQAKQAKPANGQKVASAGSLAAKFATPWLNPATRQTQQPERPAAAPASPPTKCRVWTASYGGQKAIIIKSADNSHINYTVLDVNPDRERQEAAAYIAAYAQGGKKIAEFKSQTLALDKAFKLCPNG